MKCLNRLIHVVEEKMNICRLFNIRTYVESNLQCVRIFENDVAVSAAEHTAYLLHK